MAQVTSGAVNWCCRRGHAAIVMLFIDVLRFQT